MTASSPASAASSGLRSRDDKTGHPLPRWVLPSVVLVPWLLFIASRQTPLYHGAGGGPPGAELLPAPAIAGAMVVVVALRLVLPSVMTHVAALAVAVCGISLLAASLGIPFANATADYCGDFCRTAIMGRFLAFFGWPVVTALGTMLAWRLERTVAGPGAADRAAWSRAWIYPTLGLGLLGAALWWRIVLP